LDVDLEVAPKLIDTPVRDRIGDKNARLHSYS
jgi:hypothetical protein